MRYNPKVLNEYAERLEEKANNTVIFYAIAYGIATAIICAILVVVKSGQDNGIGIAAGLGLLFGAALGAGIGNAKAFRLRVEAQRTLLDMAIEENTRPHRAASAQATSAAQK